MKHIFKKFIVCFLFISAFLFTKAQTNFFTDIPAPSINIGEIRTVVPEKYRNLSLDTLSLLNLFKTRPIGRSSNNFNEEYVIEIPMPDGTSGKFNIWESSIMEPKLATKFPEIKTYTGQGVDDKTATIKIDWTDLGFHAMILSAATGDVFVDPYTQGNKTNYISYFKSDFKGTQKISEPDSLPDNTNKTILSARPNASILSGSLSAGTALSTYRLAIACTHQYAIAATGFSTPTVAQTLSAIVTTVQRVNGIYETELSINLVLIGGEGDIIFNDAGSDPLGAYNNSNNVYDLIEQGQNQIDSKIGNANYDIGETFSTGAGGASVIGVVCEAGMKASSAVGVLHPVGDPFNVDYVSHEIGHEFGAHHPFNSNTNYCAYPGQQYAGTNAEPGSGSTIVGYASSDSLNGLLCGSDNLQPRSDPYFNGVNFDEIINYANSFGTCAVVSPTANHPPVVNAGADYTIPVQTPFVLTGSAIDPDGDSLTYCWEEQDVGGEYCSWNAPVNSSYGSAPIFRSFLPVTTPIRYFPKLSDVINDSATIGEIMPMYSRTMKFRLTARDNKADGGGVANAENMITVDGSSGPFVVTYPNTTQIKWNANDNQTIIWNPAGTAMAPVNCNNVSILLSTDGGYTYPYTLLTNVPNTGSAQIQVPIVLTSKARIKVASVGNIFYDISDNNFTIQEIPEWSIYPNPTNGVINMKNNLNNMNVEVALFDIAGKLVYKSFVGTMLAENAASISINQLPKGLYILKIHSDSDVETRKIVLQ